MNRKSVDRSDVNIDQQSDFDGSIEICDLRRKLSEPNRRIKYSKLWDSMKTDTKR